MSAQNDIILIAGGNGYIGSALTTSLRGAGLRVYTLGRRPVDHPDHLVFDITNLSSLENVAHELRAQNLVIRACIHTASPKIERVPFFNASTASVVEHLSTAVQGTSALHTLLSSLTANDAVFIALTSSVIRSDAPQKLGAYFLAKKLQHVLVTEYALSHPTIRHYTIEPGFLPGGLNSDLPKALQEHFAQSAQGGTNSVQDVAQTVLAILQNDTVYPPNNAIDPHTGTLHPFLQPVGYTQ